MCLSKENGNAHILSRDFLLYFQGNGIHHRYTTGGNRCPIWGGTSDTLSRDETVGDLYFRTFHFYSRDTRLVPRVSKLKKIDGKKIRVYISLQYPTTDPEISRTPLSERHLVKAFRHILEPTVIVPWILVSAMPDPVMSWVPVHSVGLRISSGPDTGDPVAD